MHTPQQLYTINSQQLAERLQTNPASIRAHRAGLRATPVLTGLPEPIQSQPKLIWLVADIEAWLESRRTFRPDSPTPSTPPPADPPPADPPRKRGRPRNVAAAAAEGSAK